MNPLTIYQDALNLASDAILACDFDRYAAMIDFPFLVHTSQTYQLVNSTADLRPTFDAMSQGLKARGVTHYERVARAADYTTRDRIEGWHHSHILIDGVHMSYPYAAHHCLVRRDQLWLFSEARYDVIVATHWPLTAEDIFAHTADPTLSRVAR